MGNRNRRSKPRNLTPQPTKQAAPPNMPPPIPPGPSLAQQVADMSKLANIQRWTVENRHPIPSTMDEAIGMGIDQMPQIDAARKLQAIPPTPQRHTRIDPQPSGFSEQDKASGHYHALRALILGQVQTTPLSPVLLPDFPDFDGKVFVKVWSVPEKFQIDQIVLMENQGKDTWDYYTDRIVAWTVVLSACDADGDLIFSQNDIAVFLNPESDRRFKEEIWREAFRHNGLMGRSHRAIIKNSEGTPNSSESSDSAASGEQASGKPTDASATEQFGAGVLPEQQPS